MSRMGETRVERGEAAAEWTAGSARARADDPASKLGARPPLQLHVAARSRRAGFGEEDGGREKGRSARSLRAVVESEPSGFLETCCGMSAASATARRLRGAESTRGRTGSTYLNEQVRRVVLCAATDCVLLDVKLVFFELGALDRLVEAFLYLERRVRLQLEALELGRRGALLGRGRGRRSPARARPRGALKVARLG